MIYEKNHKGISLKKVEILKEAENDKNISIDLLVPFEIIRLRKEAELSNKN